MSTQHLRKDKTCLNCGQEVQVRFCSYCGQENVQTKESFRHLVSHFFQDITHYDSKFLTSLKFLFFYPGLLTKEYINGKRMAYINPIRLYVFTSFVFFLILGMTGNRDNPYEREVQAKQQKEFEAMLMQADSLQDALRQGRVAPADTASTRNRIQVLRVMGTDTIRNAAHLYDSIQQSMPPQMREDWWERKIQTRTLEMRDKYGTNMGKAFADKVLYSFPKLMFLLLPFFALLLKWFFRRKSWVYADHAIFSIHFHTFIFMFGILGMLLNTLLHSETLFGWMMIPVFLYFVFAVRNAYQVSTGTALLRSLGILAAYALGTIMVGFISIFLIFAFS
ncbi:DUF3667 domain-containing protein [Chitinophaga barathri]|uniref:DUF3667 domain-containing protein n=1 Tax=Chitinophaga barathri TaxID=1647451 RepID=UPI0013C41B33|nr:DUF3667 domain-containing protein [Chitinophaga barathri]